jgi:uncharacterized RDD family membrane protein YckC
VKRELSIRERLAHKGAGADVVLTTPEGIPLSFTIASASDRANAFILDFLIQIAIIVAAALLAGAAGAKGVFGLVFFLVSIFYWIWFEIRWQGASPGKRWMGLRVMDARGGPLTAEAVITRNLTRQLEIWLPGLFLLAPAAAWPNAPGWARLLSMLWLAGLALMPLLNRHRLRVGDMIAGTIVVLAPKAVLLTDQSVAKPAVPWRPATGAGTPEGAADAGAAPLYAFTTAQLDVYGIFELQVLEQVLRQAERGDINDLAAIETVCEKIKVKIGWEHSAWRVEPERFLRDFYAALRARLEHRMLLGKRKEDKFSR